MTTMLFAISLAFAGDCPAVIGTDELVRHLAAADASFIAMNVDQFKIDQARVLADLPCLSGPIDPSDAAAVHRMQALASFVDADDAGTVAAFRAAAHLQPDFAPPDRVAPEGHPLRMAWTVAKSLPPSALTPLPKGVTLYVDGTKVRARPTEHPYVLQSLTKGGKVQSGAWLAGNAPLPVWAADIDAAAAAPDEPKPLKPPKAPKEPKPAKEKVSFLAGPAPWLIGAGVALGTAGGLYANALAAHSQWEDPATPIDELDPLRSRANTSTIASGVFGVAGLGLATAGVVVAF